MLVFLIAMQVILNSLIYSIMSQDSMIKLRCNECKQINYHSTKNKKTKKEKIELKKHCPFCKKHTKHIEMKGK